MFTRHIFFAKFAKLNPREKSIGSQFAKLNPREKKFFLFFRISKTCIFTLGSLSVSDGRVKNTLQDIKYKQRQHRKKNVNLFIRNILDTKLKTPCFTSYKSILKNKKVLELVSLSHFFHVFRRKIFLLLYFIN